MSTLFDRNYKCHICGKESSQRVLGSTNAFGSPDLDLRPPEMQRGTMPFWIQECPHCGYVAGEIDTPTVITSDFLQQTEYRTCDGVMFSSYLSKRFYRRYLIAVREENTRSAFFALLHAAWECDDRHDTENAALCRRLSIPLLDRFIQSGSEDKTTLCLVKADIMRRSGQFDRMKEEFSAMKFADDFLNRILSFQLSLAEKRDTACYKVSDVK